MARVSNASPLHLTVAHPSFPSVQEETDQLVLEFPDSGLRESFQKLSQERSDAAFAEREPEF